VDCDQSLIYAPPRLYQIASVRRRINIDSTRGAEDHFKQPLASTTYTTRTIANVRQHGLSVPQAR